MRFIHPAIGCLATVLICSIGVATSHLTSLGAIRVGLISVFPLLLLVRPKWIRDYFGTDMPFVLAWLGYIALTLQVFWLPHLLSH